MLTESYSQPLTFASSKGSVKMRMSTPRAKMDRPFTAGQLNPSLFSTARKDFFFLCGKSLHWGYIYRGGNCLHPWNAFFTTGHCVNQFILLFESFFIKYCCKVSAQKAIETLQCPSKCQWKINYSFLLRRVITLFLVRLIPPC